MKRSELKSRGRRRVSTHERVLKRAHWEAAMGQGGCAMCFPYTVRRQILADERARASRADAELRSALESALRELKRNAATWIALEPILSAHVYEYAPRGDGHVWNAYTRFARAEQALAVAEKARAALAGVSRGE